MLIVAYNLFMNAVDRFDQKCAACAILRKKMHVSQSIFTWILDEACITANALRTILEPGDEIDLLEFKRRIALDSVRSYIKKTGGNQWNKRPRTNELIALFCSERNLATTSSAQNETPIPSIWCHYVLVDKKSNKRQIFQGRCILCHLFDKRPEAKFGCTGCKQYYHVNCFELLHNDGKLKTIANIHASLAENNKVKDFVTGKIKWNTIDQEYIGTVEDMNMAYNN